VVAVTDAETAGEGALASRTAGAVKVTTMPGIGLADAVAGQGPAGR